MEKVKSLLISLNSIAALSGTRLVKYIIKYQINGLCGSVFKLLLYTTCFSQLFLRKTENSKKAFIQMEFIH